MDLSPPAWSCACSFQDDAAVTIFQDNGSSNFLNPLQPTNEDRVINVSLHESGDASLLSSSGRAAAARLQTFEDMPFLDPTSRLRAHGTHCRHSSPAGGPLVLHPNTWSTPRNFPKEAMCQTLSATRPGKSSNAYSSTKVETDWSPQKAQAGFRFREGIRTTGSQLPRPSLPKWSGRPPHPQSQG